MKEPVKYEKNAKGNWVLTQAWKEWRKQQNKPKPKLQPEKKKKHEYKWKLLAWSLTSQQKIFVCACMSPRGESYAGCGAMARRRYNSAPLEILNKPRFE